jgi:lysozyme family protein
MRKHIIFLFVVAQFIAPLIFIGCSGCQDDTKISADIGHDHTLTFILIHEGGVTPDGLTYAGITQHTWTAWREKQTDKAHLPKLVKNLAGNPRRNVLEDSLANARVVRRFYYDYFHDWHAWDVHPALQLIYADFVVLSGSEAVREVQKLVGVAHDGAWGLHTAMAVKKFNAKLDKKNKWKAFLEFDKMKRAFFNSLAKRNPAKYKSSLSNWLKRSDDLKTYMEPMLKEK